MSKQLYLHFWFYPHFLLLSPLWTTYNNGNSCIFSQSNRRPFSVLLLEMRCAAKFSPVRLHPPNIAGQSKTIILFKNVTPSRNIYQRRWTWTGDFKCREVKTGFYRNRSMQTGSSGTLIGWKSGQTTFVPPWGWMEGAWLRTLDENPEFTAWDGFHYSLGRKMSKMEHGRDV